MWAVRLCQALIFAMCDLFVDFVVGQWGGMVVSLVYLCDGYVV